MGKISRDAGGNRVPYLIFLVLLAGAVVGCGSSKDFYSPQAMGSVPFGAGRHHLQMEVVPTSTHTQVGADIHLAVAYRNLAFISSSNGYRADYTVTAKLEEVGGEQIVHQGSWRDSLLLDSYQETQQEETVAINRHLAADPGTYNLRVTFKDNTTGKVIAGRKQLEIPAVKGDTPVLGTLYMQSQSDSTGYRPVVSSHVPTGESALRATANLYNTSTAQSVHVTYSLIRFRTDFSRAQPPHALTPMFGSIEYKGITYDEVDTVKTAQYNLSPAPDESTLNFDLPEDLDSGIYQVSVATRMTLNDSGRTVAGHQNRWISIKGANFPNIRSLDKAVRALSYVMEEEEVEAIREADDWETRKRRFDAFWGEQVGNRSRASDVLRLYFDRVEQANRLFTNHKEGWKTDRGMVYIVFGSPRYVENYVNSEVWFYGSSGNDPTNVFLFKKVRRSNDQRGSFYNYVLQRQPYYSRKWRSKVSEWRQGEVY